MTDGQCIGKELRDSYTKYSFKIKPYITFCFLYHMQHLLEIYNHLAQTKSQRFTDKRKAELLLDEIKDAWDHREDILFKADHEEIVQLVLSTHIYPPLLMSIVKQLTHQSCIRVVNALISLLDMENIRQVLRHCKTIAPSPPEDSDDSDDEDSDEEEDKDYDPPLVTAIMKKDIPIGMIEMLLQEECDPNSMIANKGPVSDEIYATNNSSLYCALHQNRRDIVELLLDKGATVTNDHYKNDYHNSGSADIIACLDDYAMVKLLLDHGADPNSSYYDYECTVIPDDDGTALILAIFNGNKRVVQLLLERGADIEHIQESNDYSGDALDFAYSVACGNADTWNEDVDSNYLDNQVFYNDCKRTPNRVAILKLVLAAATTNSRQTVLLRDAMLRPGCKEFAQMFLDKGVDVNFTEALHNEFDTPFLCILMKYEGYRGTTTRADFLEFCYLNDIFDINSKSIKELISGPTIDNAAIYEYMNGNYYTRKQKSIVKTSLHFPDVFEETLPQLQRIIRQTTDINACGDSEGHVSPLHCAIEHRSVEVVAMLLADERINVNVLDEDGDSPLFYACYNTNNYKISGLTRDADLTKIDMLLDAGCNVDTRNHEGCTALMKMCWWIKEIEDHTVEIKACEKLLKAGADPNKAENDGRTPVSVVKNSELAILLLNYGGRIEDAPDNYKIEYREYRTQLNNENRTVDQANLPDLVRLATQRLNGIHCERCHKLIMGDSRKDGNGQICMECYNKLHPARKNLKRKERALYNQWVKF